MPDYHLYHINMNVNVVVIVLKMLLCMSVRDVLMQEASFVQSVNCTF